MKKLILLLMIMSFLLPICRAEPGALGYRYADAEEAARLLLSNRDYYENLTQNDLNFRMQKLDATLRELEDFAAAQTRDFTDAEKARIDRSMAAIMKTAEARGYALPPVDDIVFAKTTMAEECNAAAYTHGTQIYIGEAEFNYYLKADDADQAEFDVLVAHELFHCLTRNHPDFRAAMYGVLGFTVVENDYEIAPEIRERMIANPDVEHHNSYAAFDIDGKLTNCVVLFTTVKPFEKPGDSFFDGVVTGLVPIDDMTTMYTSDDAANFLEVFGENTDYVIDPEETLADNFADLMIYGLDGKAYKTQEIVQAIDARLKAGFAGAETSHTDEFLSGLSLAWNGFLGMASDAGKAVSDWADASGVTEWMEGASRDISSWANDSGLTDWANTASKDISDWFQSSGITEWAEGASADLKAFIEENGPEVEAWLNQAGDDIRSAWNTLVNADQHTDAEVQAAYETVVEALEP